MWIIQCIKQVKYVRTVGYIKWKAYGRIPFNVGFVGHELANDVDNSIGGQDIAFHDPSFAPRAMQSISVYDFASLYKMNMVQMSFVCLEGMWKISYRHETILSGVYLTNNSAENKKSFEDALPNFTSEGQSWFSYSTFYLEYPLVLSRFCFHRKFMDANHNIPRDIDIPNAFINWFMYY